MDAYPLAFWQKQALLFYVFGFFCLFVFDFSFVSGLVFVADFFKAYGGGK